MPDLDTLSIDQRYALKLAATTLHDEFDEFDDFFSNGTIERFLETSYDQFADTATVHNFLPLMAERFARQRLRALARVEGTRTDGTPIVLFLCVHNAGRSQIALGWFNHLAGDRAVAWSGGSEPGTEIKPAAVAVMAEVGIDITAELPKPWTAEIVQAADVVITMGCGDACPSTPANATKTGNSTTPPANTSRPSAPSAMRSVAGSKTSSPRYGQIVADQIPGAEFVVLEGEAHQPFQESPTAFNQMVADFWSRTDQALSRPSV